MLNVSTQTEPFSSDNSLKAAALSGDGRGGWEGSNWIQVCFNCRGEPCCSALVITPLLRVLAETHGFECVALDEPLIHTFFMEDLKVYLTEI